MTFDCPRCQQLSDDEHYGPCATCRDQLRASVRGSATVVEIDRYEPKMNVVPNQVATKE
jgi:hypothetical protein